MITLEEYGQIKVIHSFKKGPCSHDHGYYIYIIDGIIINTGIPRDGRELEERIGQYNIRLIVNTHYHLAAVGNNARLQRRFSVPIKAHKRIVYQLRYPKQSWPEKIIRGRILPSKAAGIPSTVYIGERRYRVVETQGKSVGHICLFEPKERWLFCGQLLNHHQVEDHDQLVKDLKKVLALKPQKVFCSCKGVIEDGYGALARYLRAITGSSVRL